MSAANAKGWCNERLELCHDWRLIDEKPEIRGATLVEKQDHAERLKALERPGSMVAGGRLEYIQTGETIRRWYCTRCRVIDSTVTAATSDSVASEEVQS